MPKTKRESRQFISICEEKLINEVQERPILYDKALKGYRKPAIRESAWQEVAVHLESTGQHLNAIFKIDFPNFHSNAPNSGNFQFIILSALKRLQCFDVMSQFTHRLIRITISTAEFLTLEIFFFCYS